MKTLLACSLAVGLLTSLPAVAGSFTGTTDLVLRGVTDLVQSTTGLTESIFDDKLVRAAREDAAVFVASAGARRGVQLEAALEHIRSRAPALAASDLQLAEAILTH